MNPYESSVRCLGKITLKTLKMKYIVKRWRIPFQIISTKTNGNIIIKCKVFKGQYIYLFIKVMNCEKRHKGESDKVYVAE